MFVSACRINKTYCVKSKKVCLFCMETWEVRWKYFSRPLIVNKSSRMCFGAAVGAVFCTDHSDMVRRGRPAIPCNLSHDYLNTPCERLLSSPYFTTVVQKKKKIFQLLFASRRGRRALLIVAYR